MTKLVGIAEFKAKCERLISQMERDGEPIAVTRRGKVVGVLNPPSPSEQLAKKPLATAFGLLRNDKYRFDDPFTPVSDMDEWEKNNPADLYRRS